MQVFRFTIISLLMCLALHIENALGQDNLQNQLFSETNQVLAQVKERKADLYAPKSFGKGMEYYKDATDYYSRGRQLEDIRERLKNAAAYFAKALDASKTAEAAFSGTMAARSDADSAGAPKYASTLWNKGEEQFQRAARTLEDGDAESAKETGSESEATFRSAELEAIEANYLSPARELLKKAYNMSVKNYAPKTLGRAEKLSLLVEGILKQNRYDTDSARQLAQEAKYEAAHAIYLYQTIRKMKESDRNLEDAFLEDESQFQRIASELGVLARFDNGYDAPVADVKAALKEREANSMKNVDLVLQSADSLRVANQTIKQSNNEIENLKQQIALMEKRLGSLTEAEQKLKEAGTQLEQKLETQRQQEGTIRQLSSMFANEEGNVLRDGSSIIIRLYGLTFPVGKSIIEQQFYPLLTKVQTAIKKFPNCHVTIEGHTDSQGSDDVNQKFPDNRPTAVAEYLMANMSVEIPINSQGYGEST